MGGAEVDPLARRCWEGTSKATTGKRTWQIPNLRSCSYWEVLARARGRVCQYCEGIWMVSLVCGRFAPSGEGHGVPGRRSHQHLHQRGQDCTCGNNSEAAAGGD